MRSQEFNLGGCGLRFGYIVVFQRCLFPKAVEVLHLEATRVGKGHHPCLQNNLGRQKLQHNSNPNPKTHSSDIMKKRIKHHQ